MGVDMYLNPPPEDDGKPKVAVYTAEDVNTLVRGAQDVLGALADLEKKDVSMNAVVRHTVQASVVTLEDALKPFERTQLRLVSEAVKLLDEYSQNPIMRSASLARARLLLMEALHG